MDELNLQEIEKKLNEEFAGGQRIVFWYDADGSFAESVDMLQLQDVIIWHLTPKNAFRTKLLLEHEDTAGKYLIYAPFEKPKASQNHLEDILLYSREFYADRLSLISAEIGLPERLRPHLSGLGRFFGIGLKNHGGKAVVRRTNAFIEAAKDMDLSSADKDVLEVLALCIVAGARNHTIDDLLYAVLSSGDIDQQEIISSFEGADLAKTFWTICAERFGYEDSKPSLLKMVLSLFAVYACRDFPEAEPKSWKAFLQESMKIRSSNIGVLLDNMMNNVMFQADFDLISSLAATNLRVGEELRKVPPEKLLYNSAFADIDELLIRWMTERELAEDAAANIAGADIPTICDIRSKLHFGRTFKAEYQMLHAGYRLLPLANYIPEQSLSDQITAYCDEEFRIDTAYRKFISGYDGIEDTGRYGDAVDNLKELICNLYQNNYLEKTVSAWNVAFEENALRRVIPEQCKFYYDTVARIKERVVVIISDAFRYECARELGDQLAADENSDVTVKAMMGTLPSYTSIGMAELLPHVEIGMGEGKSPAILADGKPTATTEQREKILLEENNKSAAITFDAIRAMKTSELRQFTSGKEIIYVYHNRIDAAGEGTTTENGVFDAAAAAIDEIFGLIRSLSKSGNVRRFLVTADHGFIYSRRKLESTDKLENIAGKEAFTDRRFIVSEKDYSTTGVFAVKLGDALKNNDERFVMLPKAMSVFKCGGGMNYVHGGSSPQELILPVVYVRTQKGIVETEDVKLNLITDIRKVTNLKVKLDFYQEQPVSDTIKAANYRIHFESSNGQLISNEILYTADSKATTPGERMVTLSFDFKKKAYSSDQNYYLKVINDKTNAEVISRQVLMDLPFTDDFGFGF